MIYHISGFPTTPDGHGGNLRSAQVAEFLRRSGPVDGSPLPVGPKRRLPSVSAVKTLSQLDLRCLCKFARRIPSALRLADRLREISSASVFVSEKYYWDPALLLAAAGTRPLMVFPQNIESLVPDQPRSLHPDPDVDLALEMLLLSQAHCCVAISEEDAAVLSRACTSVLTLPYYPASERLARLLGIRRERETSIKRHVLILGTVYNPPTRNGIEKLLRGFSESKLGSGARNAESVILAGHGTESFAGQLPEAIQLEGSVSPERLRELQVEAKALLIYHPKTSGSLTRVVEALICGIPVIANENAARGHKRLHGLQIEDTLPGLWHRAVSVSEGEMPNIPCRPAAAEERIRQEFRKFLSCPTKVVH